MFHVPENYRLKQGVMSSDYTFGNSGAFIVPYRIHGIKQTMFVIASDQLGWEHVSVSREAIVTGKQIGRASCRERVCLYV